MTTQAMPARCEGLSTAQHSRARHGTARHGKVKGGVYRDEPLEPLIQQLAVHITRWKPVFVNKLHHLHGFASSGINTLNFTIKPPTGS